MQNVKYACVPVELPICQILEPEAKHHCEQYDRCDDEQICLWWGHHMSGHSPVFVRFLSSCNDYLYG
jgi:hypothetical protein